MTTVKMDSTRGFPVVTAVAVAIATAAAILQYAVPSLVPELQRDPAGPPPGQWWRWVTPLLVQTLGWYQVLTNLVTLAIFGAITEWLLGPLRWLVLFAGGAVGGQIAAYAWHEPGGGDSIAICGLAAGATVTLLARYRSEARYPAHAIVYYVAALTGWGFSGILAAALACLAAAILLHRLGRIAAARAERVALAGAAACAVALAAARDLHGVSLTSGMALMTFLLVAETSVRPRG